MNDNSAPEPRVEQDPTRFFIAEPGGTAVLEYELIATHLLLKHTEVPETLRGRGLGQALARAALEHARASGYDVIPVCPHVIRYLAQHPEYQTLVTGRFTSG